jgi:uncharacterized metal-binding protein YceD (DUF177 family)
MQQRSDLLKKPVALSELSDETASYTLEADATQRDLVAETVDIEGVVSFAVDLRLRKDGQLVTAAGNLRAELDRVCVVSLEPMVEQIDEDFTAVFTTEQSEEEEGEFEADLDAPEPLHGEHIDLWDVALEQLVLSMSAHPRKEGATAPEDPGAGAKISPFDVLKDLRSES